MLFVVPFNTHPTELQRRLTMAANFLATVTKIRDVRFWAFLSVGLTLLVVGLAMVWSTWEIGAFIGTVLSTFLGAWLAFNFGKVQRDDERRNAEIAAGNRALFTLAEMYNEMRQYQKEVVEPYRGKHDAWINLHITGPLNERLFFEIGDLIFLLPTAGGTFFATMLEQRRYDAALQMINDHRRLILENAWPKMEKAGITLTDSNRPTDELEKILGPSTTKQLHVLAQGIITNIDENEKSLRAAFDKLREKLMKLHPEGQFLGVKFPPIEQASPKTLTLKRRKPT